MSETIIVSLVTAAVGLIGVIIGTIFPLFHEWWKNQQHAHYLAIRIVCILDEFLEQCTLVVSDNGLYRGEYNSEGNLESQVELPKNLPLPDDIDWRCIDHSLMYRILALPSRISQENRSIIFTAEHSFPPDFEEFFEERCYRYACLGLEVADLTQQLRRKYQLPDPEVSEWNPESFLKEERYKIITKREDRVVTTDRMTTADKSAKKY